MGVNDMRNQPLVAPAGGELLRAGDVASAVGEFMAASPAGRRWGGGSSFAWAGAGGGRRAGGRRAAARGGRRVGCGRVHGGVARGAPLGRGDLVRLGGCGRRAADRGTAVRGAVRHHDRRPPARLLRPLPAALPGHGGRRPGGVRAQPRALPLHRALGVRGGHSRPGAGPVPGGERPGGHRRAAGRAGGRGPEGIPPAVQPAGAVLRLRPRDFAYALVQEKATQLYYQQLRAVVDEPVLGSILNRLSRDEARHFTFMAAIVTRYLREYGDSMVDPVREVIADFRMPLADTMSGYWRWALRIDDAAAYG